MTPQKIMGLVGLAAVIWGIYAIGYLRGKFNEREKHMVECTTWDQG